MKPFIFLLLISFGLYCCSSEPSIDLSIIPGERVGKITKNSTIEELIETYGKKDTKKASIYIAEGEETPGLLLFPGTQNELEVAWDDPKKGGPAFVRIAQEGTEWITANGITVGTSLAELEEANGRPFQFYGFDWDFGGLVSNWQGGELDGLIIALNPTNFEALNDQFLGDIELYSDNPGLKHLGLHVASMVITFE